MCSLLVWKGDLSKEKLIEKIKVFDRSFAPLYSFELFESTRKFLPDGRELIMLTEDTSPSLWFVEPADDKNGTIDHRSFISSYPHRSLYQADVLINGHLNKNWNSCWTKVVAVNELIIGLIIFILGVLIVFFQLTFSSTAHGIWTGVLAFLAGLCAFFTIIIRRHRYFLIVATVHILAGLASTILIFISIFALASQVNHNFHSIPLINDADRQLNFAFHITLIVLGLYEKLLCYTFLVMIIRHTHKMV